MDFCAGIFQAFSLLLRNIYVKKQIWVTASELYWFNVKYTYAIFDTLAFKVVCKLSSSMADSSMMLDSSTSGNSNFAL